jgi:hypothetical protein
MTLALGLSILKISTGSEQLHMSGSEGHKLDILLSTVVQVSYRDRNQDPGEILEANK